MENNLFKDLIKKVDKYENVEFIGYGNPNAKILIIGKECAIDPKHDKNNIYELSIKNNKKQWLKIINETNNFDTGDIPSWFSACPMEEKFSPLFPFKGEKFTINRKDKTEGTSTTWYNYQKLIDEINKAIQKDNSQTPSDRKKDSEIDFLKDCFITEFNDVCSLYSRRSSEVIQSIKNRTENLLNDPFFKSFPIIIVACGHYIRQYKHIIDLQKLFEVEWDGQTVFVDKKWYNIHKGNGKILIHTNQLSINISNQLLKDIAKECKSII